MSRATRLARPPSAGAGPKLPSPRKECGGRALSVGEKLMRAGSDGIHNRPKPLTVAAGLRDRGRAPSQGPGEQGAATDTLPPKAPLQGSVHKPNKSNLKVTSPDDASHVGRRQASPNGPPPLPRADAKSSRTLPRRHTLGGARGAREVLAMQPPDMDKKREAFLEHLKQKYPHHASAIMGHQERLREQSRSPKHGPQSGVGDQADHLSLASLESLDAASMSEADAPTAFTRGSRVRASLPVVRSTNQTKDRSLGVLYLQYGDETKQFRMPNEITGIDTVRALFVSVFPQQLTMKMLESPSMAVYVKDDMRNMYYELTDVRNITDHSCLKVYHKDPAQAFSHGPRAANGDARLHTDGQQPLRPPPMGPPAHHPLQGGLPQSPHSMPSSPSRIPFGPRPGSVPSTSAVPRERLSNANPPARSVSPCPSAILERRDVKPDEDVGGKGHREGLYADPFLLQEGRLSLASAHGPHPNPGHDGADNCVGGFHRASVRSTSSYSGPSPTDSMDHPSLYRQKSRNSQLPTLGSKTPPPSPHRMAEVRLIDIHGVPPPGVPMDRSSQGRQSFRKEDVAGTKPRNNMGSPAELPGQPPVPPAGDHQTRQRMKAMEQQIASLAGLVQHALLKGPSSDRPPKTSSPAHSAHSAGGSPVLAPKGGAAPSDQVAAPLKVDLLQFRKNVSELRLQLHHTRQLQLQNQEALRLQLKRAEQEISSKLAEALRHVEDPAQRQRALVEEERHKYLGLEECVLTQLGDLEQYVSSLTGATHGVVTLKDVEEGAVTLRKVGESLAGLKGEFPPLQTRMRAVLRVEVEAVKFLKEEPHKLDSMLKRVRSLTDALSGLRRLATDPSAVSPPVPAQPNATPPPLDAQSSTVRSEVMPSSPVVVHHVQSSPVLMQRSQQSAALTAQPSPPLTPLQVPSPKEPGRESPKVASVDPPSPAHHQKTPGGAVNNGSQGVVIEEQSNQDRNRSRATSIEAAEKEWEERRQNMGQDNMPDQSTAPPPAAGRPADGRSSGRSPAGAEEPCSEPDSDPPVKKGPEKLPKPEKPSKTAARPPPVDTATRPVSEKASKSPPPPPPPRKTFPNSGMTTTRSGEVVYTSRKEPASAQEGDDQVPPPASQPKPAKVAPETKPKPPTPPPVSTSVSREEEDEGDKIMAELQVFQKCTVKDVGGKHLVEPSLRIEPQIKELRAGGSLPLKERKSSEPSRDDKDPDTDENGNTAVRPSQGVIFYVTGQIPKDRPPEPEEAPERREPAQPPTQVSHVTVNDNSPPPKSPTPLTPPPISPKPVGLSKFKLPKKQPKRPESAKSKMAHRPSSEPQSSRKSLIPELPVRKTPQSPGEGSDPAEAALEDLDGGAGLSPDLPGEEAPPPPDNIAFMITNTKVQALSCGEYRELVNAKKGSVQTVTVGVAATEGSAMPQDNRFTKKPVIIIFDEPMDIRSAYKRLSTIFESEEELERMLSEERIDEENEESDTEREGAPPVKGAATKPADDKKYHWSQGAADRHSLSSSSSSSISETSEDAKQDGKKKFKFKFPKKQLAALSQAIRTGTKTGKKTLQVVVYEDEEECDGTVRQHREAKRFEITRSKSLAGAPKVTGAVTQQRQNCDSHGRTDEIRKNTYKTLDSLEQTIRRLETTISEMGPLSPEEPVPAEAPSAGSGQGSGGGGLKRSSSLPTSRGSGPKNTTVASPASRMPVPLSAKSRQSPAAADKAGKQPKLQDAQRQFRQANGSAKRVGGDHKTTSLTLPISKIPAFYPSSAKGSSHPAPNSDATNPINPSSSSSSTSSSKSSILSCPAPRSATLPSSHIPALSNGSLKLPAPSQHTGKALSFSSQTPNGRVHSSSSSSSSSSFSSSSPSPLSPTPLGPGGKSIRTIHTPSFTSYRPPSGSSGKSCIPTATSAKDAT